MVFVNRRSDSYSEHPFRPYASSHPEVSDGFGLRDRLRLQRLLVQSAEDEARLLVQSDVLHSAGFRLRQGNQPAYEIDVSPFEAKLAEGCLVGDRSN